MLGCYTLFAYLLQLNCTSENDELMATGVICSQKLKDLVSNFCLHERVELSQMHVVLYDLKQE